MSDASTRIQNPPYERGVAPSPPARHGCTGGFWTTSASYDESMLRGGGADMDRPQCGHVCASDGTAPLQLGQMSSKPSSAMDA
jgi:hypothetical protein